MKLLFPLLFIFFIAGYLFSFDENGELAEVYLEKSYYYYNLGQFDICKEYLNKSLNYSDEIPEYYYISNIILTSDKKNKFQKAQNSLKIVSHIEKSFLIKKYNMLQNAAKSFKNVRDFEKTFETYSLIFKINDEDLKKDYFDCIDSLFNSKIRGRLKDVIASAKSVFTDPDLDYYEVLYYAMENKIERKDFDRKISSFEAINYSPIKILYLKTLYYFDGSGLFEEYFGLKNKNDNKLLKKIIFNIMQKKKGVSDKQIVSILNEWLNLGFLSDYYTNLILNNPKMSKIIKSNKMLNDAFFNYTGARIKDEDDDGDFEGYEDYINGILRLEIFDSNQDGINEYSVSYDEKSVVKNLTIFNKSDDYSIYNFNGANKSLENVEIVKKGEIVEKIYLIKSVYFPDKLDILKNKEISGENIDYKEIYEEGYSYIKYDKGKIVYEYADNDKNGYFETKKFYENDEIFYAIRDTDENGFYEIKEMYRKGKIYSAYYKTNDIIDRCDYIENISDDKTEKMWDDNLDGIFETKYSDYKNGVSESYFDIDYDGIYDFVFEFKNRKKYGLYEIKNGKKVLVKKYSEDARLERKGIVLITPRSPEEPALPESIDFTDKKRLNGIYIYKGKKSYFENGILRDSDFEYKMFFIHELLYLIDYKRQK